MKSDHYTYPNVVLSFIYILCYFLDFDDKNPNILSRDYRNCFSRNPVMDLTQKASSFGIHSWTSGFTQ